MNGAKRIAAERKRQIKEEGWSEYHDDVTWSHGELARAAACYAMPGYIRKKLVGDVRSKVGLFDIWPWNVAHWKPAPDNRIRELEKAGALIVAEIDRLLRLEKGEGQCAEN